LLVCRPCRCASIYASRLVSIPRSFKGRNHIYIRSKCTTLMLFLDQDLIFFPVMLFAIV
jgi:hypothetical protein